MKDKIYVKNVFGDIYKVDDSTGVMYKTDFLYNRIVKQSNNIIDLIQIGDLVELIDVLNQEIICIWDDEMLKAVRKDIENGLKIGRILTKEKFNQECFKVVE